jgi:hypothetical protein
LQLHPMVAQFIKNLHQLLSIKLLLLRHYQANVDSHRNKYPIHLLGPMAH